MRVKSIKIFANANINEGSKMTINEKIFTEIKEKSLKKADLARLLQVNTSVEQHGKKEEQIHQLNT